MKCKIENQSICLIDLKQRDLSIGSCSKQDFRRRRRRKLFTNNHSSGDLSYQQYIDKFKDNAQFTKTTSTSSSYNLIESISMIDHFNFNVNNVNNFKSFKNQTTSRSKKNVNSNFLSFLLFCLFFSFAFCDRNYVQLNFETEENLSVNTLIGQIRVPDSYHHDYTQPPYLILPVNGQQKGICNPNFDLNIDQHTGDIRNAIQIDREKCSLYKFLAISKKGISFQITIKIIDRNDNKPFFSVPSINIQLPENSKPNSIRRQLPFATDLDADQYGLQSYRIKSGNVNNAFKLITHRENDGILYVDLQPNKELDREEISHYRLMIEALDGGLPPFTAELEVKIEILDVNDEIPSIEKSVYNVKLPQNATIGTKLIQIQATDKDQNQNGEISYSIQESANTLKLMNKNSLSNRLFEIDNKGWITLVNNPTNLPKSLSSYELIVIAKDGGDIPLESNALVIISMPTNNFNQPKINVLLLNDNNQPELNESTRVGEIVARVIITDEDNESEQTNKIIYKLVINSTSSSTNYFEVREIDLNTYLLIVASKLDREQQENFDLKLTAYQQNNSAINSSQLLHFKLIDANDEKPYFLNKVDRVKLNLYSELGTLVYQFIALDKDLASTNKFSYSIDEVKSDKEALEWFELNKSTGELKVKKFMNCNLNKSPQIVINVDDGLNEGESGSLIIELQSNNNHIPIFESTFYNVTIDESESIGHCFITFNALDFDCGYNASIQYSLMATNRADLPLTNSLSAFQLNKTSGELCLINKLDYEKRYFYELIIVASNPSTNSSNLTNKQSSTSIVHIYVKNSNDHSPKFLTTQYKVNVHENIVPLMPSGLPAPILIVKAYDEDNLPNSIIYSIINGNDDFCFEIEEQSGKLFLLKPLSSVRSFYTLTVIAEDGEFKSENQATIHVNVLNSGFQKEYLHFNTNLYNFNLIENALIGTKIGRLNVQSSSFDHHVNMYNNNQTSSSQLLSNGHLLDFSIYSGNEQQLFQLDSTGELTLTKNSTNLILNSYLLDYEFIQNHLINVQCRLANGNNEFTYAYTQINISIVDLNDCLPAYNNDLSVISLKENSIRSTTSKPVFAVKAIDSDSGLFGRIRYHFRTLVQDQFENADQVENTDQVGPFYMNKFTGEIYLNGELDYEQQSNYELTVLAVDGGGRTNEMHIKVNVIDVSDNQPTFSNSNQQPIEHLNLTVNENLELNTLLYHFSSIDQDTNDHTFFYSILNERQQLINGTVIESTQSQCFKLSLISGDLRVNCVLDAEQVTSFELKLQVKDIGDNRAYLLANLTLKNLNDNVSQFQKYEYRFQVSEDSAIGTKIGQITGYDLDKNSQLKYELLKDFDTFRLNSSSGELYLMKKLDRECDKPRFVLKAQISDIGDDKVELINDKLATILIDVLNVNNHSPVWLDQNQSISAFIKQQCAKSNSGGQLRLASAAAPKIEQFKIPTQSQISTLIHKVRAYDMDQDDQIQYTIKHVQQQVQSNDDQFVEIANGKELFAINSDGLITTKQQFTNKNTIYRLAIEATDSKGLKADHLKWIEILVKSTNINNQNKMIRNRTNNSNIEYIEIENSLLIGQSIGPIIDLKHFKQQQVLNGCETLYLSSEFHEIDLPFTLNINETKINLVSLINSIKIEPTSLQINFRSIDCSLCLTKLNSLVNGYEKLIQFEITIQNNLNNQERSFDCLRNQLKNSEFGEELMQIHLDLNQEYEKIIDLYDFKRFSTIQSNQHFKLTNLHESNQHKILKVNSDLILQLILDDNQVLNYDDLLIQIEAINEFTHTSSDNILMNFILNRRSDLNLNNLKIINNNQSEVILKFDENCCQSGEIIYHILLNYDLSESSIYKVNFLFLNNNQTQYEIFQINSNGLLSLISEFDYETKSMYNLKIQISIESLESGKLIKQLETSILIYINDLNDERPIWTNQDTSKDTSKEIEIDIIENVPVGTLLTKLNATDRDQSDQDNLTYLIADGYQYKKIFELNSKTGELRLKLNLDRERQSFYRVPILVLDSDQHFNEIYLNLKLKDINDNKPTFSRQQLDYSIQIPENIPINTKVYTFIATDDDDDETNQLSYELINCEELNCPFHLDSKSGELITKNQIDYETTTSYNLTISATDGLYTSNCNLFVKILNLNDNCAKFEKEFYELQIDLDQLKANEQLYFEIIKLKAIDQDKNSKLYYSLVMRKEEGNDDVNYFTLNSTTGQLFINEALLNEMIRRKLINERRKEAINVEFDVQLIDITEYNVLSARSRIRIQFIGSKYLNARKEEINELKKEWIKFNQYPIMIELNEQFLNKKLSDYLQFKEEEVTFKLINQTADFAEQFYLDSTTGEFSLRQPLRNKNYECFVLAKTTTYGETLNLVQFTRVPMIHSPNQQVKKFSFDLNLEENLEIGYRLIELEERVNIYLKNDHHFQIIYSSVNVSWFTLDSRTGLLRTAIRFDYERHPNKIELIVLASQPNSYNNIMLFNLSINLINLNDNAIIFNHPIIYTTINESLPKDTFVCRLGSIDLDSIYSMTTISYHIVEGNRDNAFKIVNNSIYTNVLLDREIRSSYTLSIFANDAQQHSSSTITSSSKPFNNRPKYQTVEIRVIDVNDNLPYFTSNQELTITDNVANQLVGTLNSNDVDFYPMMLTYELVNDLNYNLNSQLFDINRFNGEIRLKHKINLNNLKSKNDSIDYDIPLKEFYFNVIASDSLHQAETRVKVNLKRNPINQQQPIFAQDIYYYEMKNGSTGPLFQVRTQPIKRTTGLKIKTQYKLVGKGSRHFNIDLNDGILYWNQITNEPLISKNKQLFRLIVQSYYAYENGKPVNNLKSSTTILIKIVENFTNQNEEINRSFTIELDRYQYGEVIYRLPVLSKSIYQIEQELNSNLFAIKNKNELVILRRPIRIETLVKIKQFNEFNNQTNHIELNIRSMWQSKKESKVFKRRLFNIQLNENTTIEHQILDLKATQTSSTNKYSIYKGNKLGHFKIDQSTGILYLVSTLNCKLVDHYNLIILATNNHKNDFTVVHIQVLPPSNHLTLPILPLKHYQAIVKENIPIGSKVIKLMDRQSLTNLDGYRFVLSKDESFKSIPFEFDQRTGYLISTSTVDYEQLANDNDGLINFKFGLQFINSNFYLRPFHNGTSPLITLNRSNNLLNSVSIQIKILGEDEFYPKFDKSLYDFKIDLQPNDTNLQVGQVHAEDADKGKDGEVFYSINSTVPSWTRELFDLNARTGIITLNLQQQNTMINSWLQSSNAYTSIIVIGKSSKANSLSSMSVVDITIQYNSKTTNNDKLFRSNNQINNSMNKISKMNNNKNLLTSSYESSTNDLKQSQSKQQSQSNIVRTINESGQRKLISSNLIQVYGIVVLLLILLLVLVIFSIILLFRICNFNRKDTTSSNNSIYNSKTQSDIYDPNGQITKSINCLIGHQNQSDSIILGQSNKLKQTDFMINMALQRNSIIYQDHNNAAYLNSNSNLIKSTTDTSSNCNTSITILHSHENSDSSKSNSEPETTGLNNQKLNKTSIAKYPMKNRALPSPNQPPPDLVNSYQTVKYYDEVREHPSTYYSNYKELENSFNHNYEAISPAYDEQMEFFQDSSWSPAYHPVTEIVHSMAKNKNKSNLKPFVTGEQRRQSTNQVKIATLANTNKLS